MPDKSGSQTSKSFICRSSCLPPTASLHWVHVVQGAIQLPDLLIVVTLGGPNCGV
jgi:hypothetical protein